MIQLDRHSTVALYRQLADQIKALIQDHQLQPDSPLDWAMVLGGEKVASQALHRSEQLLAEDGWLKQGQAGEGWIVSVPPGAALFHKTLAFDPAALKAGGEGSSEIRVLSKTLTTIPRQLLDTFNLKGTESRKAFRILRLHLEDNQPQALEAILAPSQGLRGLMMKDHRHRTIYEMLVEDYLQTIEAVTQQTHVRLLTSDEADLLEASVEFPALCVERTVTATNGLVLLVDWVSPAGRCSLVDRFVSAADDQLGI